MSTLLFGRDIGVSMRNKNMAAPYEALQISISMNISTLGQRTNLKLRELPSLFIFYDITISRLCPLNGF